MQTEFAVSFKNNIIKDMLVKQQKLVCVKTQFDKPVPTTA